MMMSTNKNNVSRRRKVRHQNIVSQPLCNPHTHPRFCCALVLSSRPAYVSPYSVLRATIAGCIISRDSTTRHCVSAVPDDKVHLVKLRLEVPPPP